MAKKQAILTFTPDGECSIETQGFKGKECKDAVKFLKSLGDQNNEKKKQEWYETNNRVVGSTQGNLCG